MNPEPCDSPLLGEQFRNHPKCERFRRPKWVLTALKISYSQGNLQAGSQEVGTLIQGLYNGNGAI